MHRSLRRFIPAVLSLAPLACPAGHSGPPPGAPGAADPDTIAARANAESCRQGLAPRDACEDLAAREAALEAHLEQDARLMRPPKVVNVIPADVPMTTSGIAHQVLIEGTGPTPGPHDAVKLHMVTWTADGNPVRTLSYRDEPKRFRMQQLYVPGLAEALALVKEGGTTRFWIPPSLTGGGEGSIIPGGTLLIQVTLAEVIAAPATPANLAAPPPDATVTASGLAFKVLEPGSGTVHPDPHDRVKVHSSVWTADGTYFNSSIIRGRPDTVPLDRALEGWAEGVQLMVVGEKTRLWIPEELAYKGRPGKMAEILSGMLVFDVELLEIDEQPEPPPPPVVPAFIKGPPRNAKRTASGLAYRVLKKGTGKEHPTATSVVKVRYSAWTTDGTMFDSSAARGKPSTYALNRLIKGWSEGVRLMVVGEKTRFWIPEKLAYNGRLGSPAGMLIFEVELLAIEK